MITKADLNLFCWRQASVRVAAASTRGCSCHVCNRNLHWHWSSHPSGFLLALLHQMPSVSLAPKPLSGLWGDTCPSCIQEISGDFRKNLWDPVGKLHLTDDSYLLSDDRWYVYLVLNKAAKSCNSRTRFEVLSIVCWIQGARYIYYLLLETLDLSTFAEVAQQAFRPH